LVRQTDAGSKAQVLDITNLAVLESEYFYLMPNDIIYVEPVKAKMAIYGSNTPYIVFSSITSALLLLSILL